MEKYNWQSHYADTLVPEEERENYRKYYFENETGLGCISEWDLFQGMQLIYNDLNMERCSSSVPLCENIIEVSYCIEGSYECDLDDERCFIIGPGDLSVGAVGRTESHGGFPKGRYCGFTLFIKAKEFQEKEKRIILELGIDIERIRGLSGIKKQRFILHDDVSSDHMIPILQKDIYSEQTLGILRLKALEIMVYLSDPEIGAQGYLPKYISSEQARIASLVQKRITNDISEHITIEQLKTELGIGSTLIKTAFKKVYGTSVYAYLKDCRLKEAMRLLRETDMKNSDIALQIGYSNPGKFSVAFKEKYGVQPGKVRVLKGK